MASCVHNLLERVEVLTPAGPARRLGDRHQRLAQDRAGLAPGGPPRESRHAQRDPGSVGHALGAALMLAPRRSGGVRVRRALVAARRQPADHLARAVSRGAARGPRPCTERERWTTPDGDFIDLDWLAGRAAAPAAASTLLVLFHGLEGSSRSHYAEAFADVARRHGLAFVVPHFRGCSGELNHGAAGLPLGRPRGGRTGSCARLRERFTRPPAGRGRLAGRQCADALGRRSRRTGRPAVRRGRIDLLADRPGRRRRGHRPRLQPARVHDHVPAHDAAQGPAQAGAASRACSIARRCWPRATCTSSTTCSPRRCMAFAAPRTTGRAHRPSRTWPASASRRSCSTRATTRSCRRTACRQRPRSATGSRLWQPAQGGHVGFPAGLWPTRVDVMPDAVTRWLLSSAR